MSVQERVGAGVVTVLSGLPWGTVGSPPAAVTPLVVLRDRPEVAEQDECSETHPTVIVVVRRGGTELLWAGKVMQTYTVGVAIAIPSPMVLGDTGPMHGYVELARKGVHGDGTVPGVGESNEVKPGAQLPFDPATLDRNFKWGVLAFDVETLEDRS